MPVHVIKDGPLYRVVETSGRLAKTENAKPRDGGGHGTKAKADAQARAINQGLSRKDK